MSRSLLSAALIVCFVLFGFPAFCQDFPMLHYTIEDGLPSNVVYYVYRDSKGYLWVATDKGIARFNGIRFEKFTTFDGLADNEGFSFREDCYGRLWFATYNGDLCYYQDGVFHTAANTPSLKMPVKIPFIHFFNINGDSSVTINFHDHRFLVNVQRNRLPVVNQFKDINREFGMSDITYARKISPDRYEITGFDSVDIIMDTGYHIVSKIIRPVFSRNLHCRTSQNAYYFINKEFVLSEDKKIVRQIKKDFFDNSFIHVYYRDGVNDFLGTNNGLFINDSLQILKEYSTTTVTQDNIGNYWVGTLSNGMYVMKKDFLNTRVLKNAYTGKVKYCYGDATHVFFAVSNNNLYSYDHEKIDCVFNYRAFRKIKLSHTSNVSGSVDKKINNDNYYNYCDAGYLIDKNGQNYDYYNYYDDDGITMQNLLGKKRTITTGRNDLYLINVKALFLAEDNIYAKAREEIDRLGNAIQKVENVLQERYPPGKKTEHRIFGIAQAPDKSVFYSTINKVYRITNRVNVEQPQFDNFSFKTLDIFDDYLLGITHNNKLVICNHFSSNPTFDSIANEDCIWLKLTRLDACHILVTTDNNYRLITLFPAPDKPRFSILTIEDPFLPRDAEAICSDSTNCFFLKDGSITTINISGLSKVPASPKLFFRSLKTSKRTISIDSVMQVNFSEAKDINVSFSTLSFSGKDVSYQYSFSKNEQDSWNSIRGEELNLVNPGYGDYFIKVRAKSVSSDYSQPIVFALHISKPCWATWWFITMIFSVVVAVIIFVVRYRFQYVFRKKERAHEAEIRFMRAEYKSLNALMNPHFIFNALNNVQSLFNGNDKLAANEYLRIFADLIRQNMQNISKELISLQKEIDLVSNYLLIEKLRFEDHLNYSINIAEGIDLSDIMIPPLLIQPLVENSLKHGVLPRESVEGVIEISIFERADILYIEVRDNGVGIHQSNATKSASHESFGLENIKKRIEQLSIIQNKKITFHLGETLDTEGKLKWTVVTISIPV